MRNTTKVDASSIVLHEGCARNLPVELHYATKHDELQVAKTRLLGLDDEHLFLDGIVQVGQGIKPVRGQSVTAYVLVEGTRYSFRSRVVNLRCRIRLNANMHVPGISVKRPTVVEQSQRREDYRVSLIGRHPLQVNLHAANPDQLNASPLDAKRYSGTIIDLSRGGMCIRVDVTQRAAFTIGELAFVSGIFSPDTGPFTLLVQVRHARKISHNEAWRVGLKFISWNRPFTQPFSHLITQYCADVQRQSLRRTR